jgi:hypothetical protein
LAAATLAVFTRPAMAADDPEATDVRGIVVQGKLPHEVKALEVTPRKGCLKARHPADPEVPAPKLVSSFPADGAVVKPGVIVFRLTFDLAMACPGLIDADFPTPNPCPAPLIDPVISKDRRTFLTICVVKPHTRYGVWLNRGGEGPDRQELLETYSRRGARWTNLAGHELGPHEITFTTSDDPVVGAVHEAIAEDPFLRAMTGQAAPPAAAAQASLANAPPESATNVAPVTVTPAIPASDLARSRRFIEAYAAPTARLDRYARWSAPPCVSVVGLAEAQAAAIKARIEEVARAAGLKVGGAGCKANVEIEFTDQPQALVDRIVDKTPQVLGFQPGADVKTLKAVTRPIQAWYMTASRGGADTLAMSNALAGPPKPTLQAPDPGTESSVKRMPGYGGFAAPRSTGLRPCRRPKPWTGRAAPLRRAAAIPAPPPARACSGTSWSWSTSAASRTTTPAPWPTMWRCWPCRSRGRWTAA